MRVLIVEDEQDLARALEKALREEGYAADTARDGPEGLFKAQSWDYDAIVLDLMLPGLDGWRLLHELRHTKQTPVLVLTARNTVDDRVRGLDTGADDYLTKPFALSELLARLRALIRRAAGQGTPVIQVGDIVLDTAARTVRKGGQLVILSAREYALVEMLILHRGKLVTRSMAYEHLYDEHEDSMSNVIDVYVASIRKKLGKDFVITRRGQGYQVDG